MRTLILAALVTCGAVISTGLSGTAAGADGGADTALVEIGPKAGGTRAFVAWPAGDNTVPAVIVVREWWGLNGQIRRLARQLARQGYVAIVPDLYHGKVAGDPEYAHELMRGLDEQAAVGDLEAAAAWLAQQPRCRDTKVGVVGFCMGGGIAEQMAIRRPSLAAAVMFYGRPVMDPESLARLKVPLMGHFGAEDRGISVDRVEKFEAALKAAGRDAQIFIYPGAGHAFMNETQDSFHPDASRQAWARTLAFFQKQLKGPSR